MNRVANSSEDRWTAIVSDPDEQAANSIAEQLRPLGLDVVKEPRIEAVGAAVRNHGRALILVAMKDSGAGAAERCREWRELARRCYITFLLEQYRDTDVAHAFNSGADDVLVKPVVDIELCTRLTRAAAALSAEDTIARLNGEAVLLAEIAVRAPMHSRRYLEDQLGNEVDRARRFAHALALILIEVVGTPHDERLIRHFGEFLHRYVRVHVDWVARYTDRSFALVLPETTLLGAVRAAYRLRGILQKTALPAAGLPHKMRVSFGVSALDEVSATLLPDTQALMDSAEAYLREAVRSGADRIIAGRPELPH